MSVTVCEVKLYNFEVICGHIDITLVQMVWKAESEREKREREKERERRERERESE